MHLVVKMFSGIVEEKGQISALSKGKGHLILTVNCSESFSKDKKIGDSVSVDGVCLTVTKKTNETLTFDAVNETLERTIIGNYIEGSCVNLESSLTFGGTVGGHLMSGHIHLKGLIKEVLITGDSKNIVIETSNEWSKYLSEKGYVGINGCSITIGKINDSRFQIHLIPETLKATNLDNLIFGDAVNLELDQSTIAIVDTTERILKHKT